MRVVLNYEYSHFRSAEFVYKTRIHMTDLFKFEFHSNDPDFHTRFQYYTSLICLHRMRYTYDRVVISLT